MARDTNLFVISGVVERVAEFEDAVLITVGVADDYQTDGEWVNRKHYVGVSFRGPTADYLKRNSPERQWVSVTGKIAIVKKGDEYKTYFNGDSISTMPAYVDGARPAKKSSGGSKKPRSKYKRNSKSIEADYEEDYDDYDDEDMFS